MSGPLVFSISGGMGPTATAVYRRLAALIADKRNEPFSRTLFWLDVCSIFHY